MNSIVPADCPAHPLALARWFTELTTEHQHAIQRQIWTAIPDTFPKTTVDVPEFWQLTALSICFLDTSTPPTTGLTLLRVLTDTLRRFAGQILYQTAQDDTDCCGTTLMEQATRHLKTHGDPAAAMTWTRRHADLLALQGKPIEAHKQFDAVIFWCQRMAIHNQIDQNQMLDNALTQQQIAAENSIKTCSHPTRTQLLNATVDSRLIPDHVLLLNSTAQLEFTRGDAVSALELVNCATEMLTRWSPSQPDQTKCKTVLHLRLLTSRLRCALICGDLAAADLACTNGFQVMQQLTDPTESARLTFRRYAGEFFYRIRNITRLEQLFRDIAADEKQGLRIHPQEKAALQTNWGMTLRLTHRYRLADTCHASALAQFQRLPTQQQHVARIQIQYASLKLTRRLFTAASQLLDTAESTLTDTGPNNDLARLHLTRGRLLHAQNNHQAALTSLATARAHLRRNSIQNASLELAIDFSCASIHHTLSPDSTKTANALDHARRKFILLKNQLILLDHRLHFFDIYRSTLIRRLSSTHLASEAQINGLLEIIEWDRADMFSASLSYLVQTAESPTVHQLFQRYIQLCQLELTREDSSQGRSENLHDTFKEIMAQLKLSPNHWIGTVPDWQDIQACLARSLSDNRHTLALAYVLDDDALYIAVIQPDAPPDFVPVPFSQALQTASREVLDALLQMKAQLIPELDLCIAADPDNRLNWRTIREQFLARFRHWQRQYNRRYQHRHTLRDVVTACIMLIETGLISIRVEKFYKKNTSSAQQFLLPDRNAYGFLYQLLIAPVAHLLKDDTSLVIIVSEILSQIPFEALRPTPPNSRNVAEQNKWNHTTFEGSNTTLIFPQRSVNYFRSPTLMSQVMNTSDSPLTHPSTANTISQLWFTPLITAKHAQNPYEPMQTASANHHETWFRATDATTHAFVKYAPRGKHVLLETHCAFDRSQPFLSRLLFAHAEPMTITDILSTLTFQATTLLILSGCESDRLHDFAVDQASLSISEAMLCKGAQQVLATRWLVQPEFSRQYIQKFKQYMQTGMSAVDALAHTQRFTAHRLIHPGHWAAFSFSGRPEETIP